MKKVQDRLQAMAPQEAHCREQITTIALRLTKGNRRSIFVLSDVRELLRYAELLSANEYAKAELEGLL